MGIDFQAPLDLKGTDLYQGKRMVWQIVLVTFVYVTGYDLWFYTMHRAMHQVPGMYKYHRKHHSVRDVFWRHALLSDAAESVLTPLGLFIPMPLVGFSLPAFICASGFCSVRAFAHHDRRCVDLVGDYHLKHHRNPRFNFGQPWIDRLFGTAETS